MDLSAGQSVCLGAGCLLCHALHIINALRQGSSIYDANTDGERGGVQPEVDACGPEP